MSTTPDDAQDRAPDAAASPMSDAKAFLTDGVALGASAIVTALVGLLGWLLAARLLEPSEVGRASAFVNGFSLVATLAELGLGQACLKWLPSAGRHTPRLVSRVYTGVLTTTVLLALVWGVLTRDNLSFQLGIGAVGAIALFIAACLAWSMFHVQDFILTGVGAARWVPVENVGFGVARIVLLIVLARSLGSLGIVLSWVLPTLLAVVLVSLAMASRSHVREEVPGVSPPRPAALRLAGSTWLSTVGMTLSINLVPLVVTARFGPGTGAVFFIVWNGVAAIEVAAAGFGAALVVRLQGDSLHLLGSCLRQVLPLFAVPLAVAAAAAPLLLRLFGSDYVDAGTTLLRLVCLGLLLRVVGLLVGAIHLGAERLVRLLLINAGSAVALIVLVLLVDTSSGLGPIGIWYAGIQTVVVALALVDLRRCAHRERAVPADAV